MGKKVTYGQEWTKLVPQHNQVKKALKEGSVMKSHIVLLNIYARNPHEKYVGDSNSRSISQW